MLSQYFHGKIWHQIVCNLCICVHVCVCQQAHQCLSHSCLTAQQRLGRQLNWHANSQDHPNQWSAGSKVRTHLNTILISFLIILMCHTRFCSAWFHSYMIVSDACLSDGLPLEDDPRHIITADRSGTCSLILDSLTAEDSGQYTCYASSSMGTAGTLAKVVVQGEYVDVPWPLE